jgi:hypothetical protein
MSQMFEVVIKAQGEVRDADGNLISSTPIESTSIITEAEARALAPSLFEPTTEGDS